MAWENREALRERVEQQCLLVGGPFRLSTGDISDFYFDCKRATLDGKTLLMVADAFLEEANQLPVTPTAVAGLTLGADPLIAAMLVRACQVPSSLVAGSIVRKERKEHGTQSKIENELPRGTPVVVVDDVITRGRSLADACAALLEAGYRIAGIVALVDRETGGAEELARRFECPVRSVFRKRDFPKVLEYERAAQREPAGHS